MVVVGYDDTRQAFHLFNSWGASWGDKGLGWVSYDALLNYTPELYVAHDVSAMPLPPPSPSAPMPAAFPLPAAQVMPWPQVTISPAPGSWWPPAR